MRTFVVLAVLVVLLCPLPAHAIRHWRLGGSYIRLVDGGSRDRLGDSWAFVGEYSFRDALTPEEDIPNDVSVYGRYTHFSKTFEGSSQAVTYGSVGLRWRGGKGARPGCDGLYGGIGLAAAILSAKPALSNTGDHQGVTKLEWSIFGGVNFAGSVYAEIGYSNIPVLGTTKLSNLDVTLGVRF